MSIGSQIARYRKSLNMTQEELGQLVGVSNQAVSKWESEITLPDVLLLPQITKALNITPTASTVMQFAQIQGKDAEYATAINAISTIGCIITMPILIMFL